MRKLTSKEIAISGMSAALALVFVLGARYISNLTLSCYILASLSIALPLMKNLWGSAILSYIASALLSFLLSSFYVMPFILFFGLFPLLAWGLDFKFYKIEKLNKWVKIAIITVIKIIYFVAVFFGCFYLMKLTVSDFKFFKEELNIYTLMLLAFVIYSLYDFLYREAYKLMVRVLSNKI
jgi:hypothetical protein